jgi:stearoyl-CoA desaturase (delta-9 desaturase)
MDVTPSSSSPSSPTLHRRDDYDGSSAFPDPSVPTTGRDAALRVGVTLALVIVPFAGFVAAVVLLWGRAFSMTDLVLAFVFYVVTGFGISIGFHRGLTHKGFTMRRPVRLALTVAGSMAFEGAVIDWVATHRRHHAFTDRPGDPHSPYRYGTSFIGQVRGLAYAHLGWLLVNDPTSVAKYAPDLLRDPVVRRVDRAFPLLCIASLALPFLLGWVFTGSLIGGLTAFIWAGLARVALLQHVTWSINSVCHVVGSRPYETRPFDRATNVWPLALLSFGESWHNGHHSAPSCARHGRGAWEVDPTASVIAIMERLHWVGDVRWTATGART